MLTETIYSCTIGPCTTLTNAEFIMELSPEHSLLSSDCEESIGKRTQASYTFSPILCMPLKMGSFSSSLSSYESQDELELPSSNLRCSQATFSNNKKLLLCFITETLLSEKINLKRLQCLPESCQTLAAIYFKENFNLDVLKCTSDLAKETAGSREKSPKDQLIHAYSFLAECYLYGLKKQLPGGVTEEEALAALFAKLHPCDTPKSVSKFQEAYFSLIEGRELDLATIKEVLTLPLLSKMRSLSKVTLSKYYIFKAYRKLTHQLEHCSSVSDITDSFVQPGHRLDLLSSYSLFTLSI